jgi:hypothetical protein
MYFVNKINSILGKMLHIFFEAGLNVRIPAQPPPESD